jgi:threonylcarbamoyladenosine tRNA methylthiotransferase MtaB
VEEIVADVSSALDGGTQEIVLTGVHLGSWGLDFQPARRIPDLVSALLARTSAPRLRLSSLEPWDLDADFFSLWHSPHLCRHLHLPLQSGSASVLRRMARKTTPDSFAALVQSARAAIPEVAITTDVIVGFPGETDEEFAETLEFVKSMHFAGGHVFSYSARPGTPAARMKGQVRGEAPCPVREPGLPRWKRDYLAVKARSTALRTILADSAESYHRKFIGKTMPVLWEAASTLTDAGWQIEGLTDNYLRVTAIAPEPYWNRVDAVHLTDLYEDGLTGMLINIV